MTLAIALELWARASAEEIGLIITLASLEDKRRVEKALYEARTETGGFEELMLAKPGDRPEELWIIKKTTDMRDVV